MESSIKPIIYTIGHSKRSLEDFIRLLKANNITLAVDIRSIPHSRHNPQFNQETLPQALQQAGIAYRHLPGLGGLRKPNPDSLNTGWRNAGFRGFADYMQTPEFEASLRELIDLARHEVVVIMCAEAVPWHCHRSLIADALTARNIPVEHIIAQPERRPHRLTPMARVLDSRITYPALL